ncbi:hypothetical protein BYT27DRAFT_7200446 [Phlegmacium glaucopus]|nr:hypothetical protein BYT27DRAFT_7200446 [Phlegmacium glaucopus]
MWSSPPPNRQNHHTDPKRLRLRDIAQGTIEAINKGHVDYTDVASNMRPTRHNLRVSNDDTLRGTEYYRPGSTRLKYWQQGPPPAIAAEHHRHPSETQVRLMKMSTLQGAHFLSETCPASNIGVLNFASATQPGGGFINGASAQEESIARSSTLYLSLQTPEAKPFYELHDKDRNGGYYSNAMIYSPSIAIFRDDDGNWLRPYHVDVLTSPAVNAGLVRKLRYGRKSVTEDKILSVMRERMGMILALFEQRRTRNLVLGSFGTGVFQNDVVSLARIWGDLLAAPDARFRHSFDRVVFAIPDSYTLRKFEAGFNAAVHPPSTWSPRL